jgi:hypothetical protein
MIEPTRTERTFGVTGELRPLQRRNLLAFRQSEVYGDVLDVIEMVCIEMESVLINTPPEQEAAVLAHHKKSQAAWQIFAHLQQKIDDEIKAYQASVAKKPPVPELSYQEQLVENILDPTKPLPSEDYEV